MIESLDIDNFGSFQHFAWKNSLRDKGGNPVKFKKLNIIYGRNYAGKTTLSRIIRSIETGKLPDKYENPAFESSTSQGKITSKTLSEGKLNIRVYNKDFVDDNLSFLKDHNCDITPFAIIGSENKAIEAQIEELENKLGSTDKKTGERYAFFVKQSELNKSSLTLKATKDNLERRLFNKANTFPGGIKHNLLYKQVNYDTRRIKADIDTIRAKAIAILSDEERIEKEALLSDKALPKIETRLYFTFSGAALHKMADELLTKNITPSSPIKELLDDTLLQMWVKEGINHHRGRLDRCGFCGQTLPLDIWSKLDEHFSKESTELENNLLTLLDKIESEIALLDGIIALKKEVFYTNIQGQFECLAGELNSEIKKYSTFLQATAKSLKRRIADIFTPQLIPSFEDNSAAIAEKIDALNNLIEENNKKTEYLGQDQENARATLRINEVANFIQDIDLEGEENKINELQSRFEAINSEVIQLNVKIQSIESKIIDLHLQLKDEKKGAEKVNEYLSHYFGHDSLCLKAVEELGSSNYKFQIFRGDNPAYNLSDGECSLVAFCYFLAKLEDTETKGKKLIIYIDDPVSSLDSNHIFFIFSLIEGVIAKSEKDAENKNVYTYEQLFISTHNLEFLKYLKKLSHPRNDSEHFLIVRNAGNSSIELMPPYLKNYITEFNYLFGEIYTCSDLSEDRRSYSSFYNFGNNLRKFLEAYLFFKYPFSVSDKGDYDRRIEKFFASVPGEEILVKRLTNEYSHLGGIFDRSKQPIDRAEIARLATFVLKKIKESDQDQYRCLLESISKPDLLAV